MQRPRAAVEGRLIVAIVCALAVAASSNSIPASLSQQGPSKICACATYTYDSEECQTAAAAFCNSTTTDTRLCPDIRDLQELQTNETAAASAAEYLGTVCKPADPTMLDTCSCFTVCVHSCIIQRRLSAAAPQV